jgi:type II secretory pathway component PulJ
MTLVEALVAMVISAMAITAIYSLFKIHHRMAVKQEETTHMQQELLAASSQIAEDLRMCGYSPTYAQGFGFAHMPGFGKPDYGRVTNKTGVYCTLDSQGDGKVDESGSGSMRDHVGYRLNVSNSGAPKGKPDNVLRKYDTGAVHWQPLATNIGDIRFSFFDVKGDAIPDAGLTPERITSVEVTITAVPSPKGAHLGIGNRTMTTRVFCRNLAHE